MDQTRTSLPLFGSLLRVWVSSLDLTSERHATDVSGDILDRVLAELALFSHVFASQTKLVVLAQVAATQCSYLGKYMEQLGFRTPRARSCHLHRVADVATSHIHDTICRKGDAIGQLSSPAWQ